MNSTLNAFLDKLAVAVAGKKTYAFLGATAAAMAVSYAGRHGVDLGPLQPDLAEYAAGLFVVGAAWARRQASQRLAATVTLTDTQGKPTAGPTFR